MKRLIIMSTALFAAASTFGVVYFAKMAHQPAIQNLYSHTTPIVEEVPENIAEYFVNQQGEIDSVQAKSKVIKTQVKKEPQKKKVLAKKKKSNFDKLDSKSFSRAAIEPVAPIAPAEETTIEK